MSLAERWFILGTTGTGKTTFSTALSRELRSLYPIAGLYVLDSKGDPFFARWPGQDFSDDPPPPLREPGGIQVWSPPLDDLAAYDQWLGGILKARRPAVVLIDELANLGNNGANFVPNLARLLKQGRVFNISVIVLSQEAAYIPRPTVNQANHLVVFRLQDEAYGPGDRKRAARLLGQPAPVDPAADFGFFYRRLAPKPGTTREYPDYRAFF